MTGRSLAFLSEQGFDALYRLACTLLGAVYMEASRYDLGQLWYAKAVESGRALQDVDNDLQNIYKCANRDNKAALSAFLTRLDPQRYAWARLSN